MVTVDSLAVKITMIIIPFSPLDIGWSGRTCIRTAGHLART